jgi:hypothetical protein
MLPLSRPYAAVQVHPTINILANYSKYVFYRKLTTGDPKDTAVTIGSNNFIWASGASDKISGLALGLYTFTAPISRPKTILSNSNIKIYSQMVDSTTIEIQLRTSKKGYAGIGFGSGRMSGTDMVICHNETSGPKCLDYTGTSRNAN